MPRRNPVDGITANETVTTIGAHPHPPAFPEAASAAIRDRVSERKRKRFATTEAIPARARNDRSRDPSASRPRLAGNAVGRVLLHPHPCVPGSRASGYPGSRPERRVETFSSQLTPSDPGSRAEEAIARSIGVAAALGRERKGRGLYRFRAICSPGGSARLRFSRNAWPGGMPTEVYCRSNLNRERQKARGQWHRAFTCLDDAASIRAPACAAGSSCSCRRCAQRSGTTGSHCHARPSWPHRPS